VLRLQTLEDRRRHGLVELEADDALARLAAGEVLRDRIEQCGGDDVERVVGLEPREGSDSSAVDEVRGACRT
jgi:hypothetical protein